MSKRNLTEVSVIRRLPGLLIQNPEVRFTAREIAEWILLSFPEGIEEKRSKSRAKKTSLDSDSAMIQQLVAEIGSSRHRISAQHPKIQTTDTRPRKYFYSLKTVDDSADPENPETDNDQVCELPAQISEQDLYPIFSSYLRDELGIFSKRIDERRARNTKGRGGNKWLFPDLVGFEDMGSHWDPELLMTQREHGDPRAKLWSFEVKKRISLSDVREYYFQSVSNSSWSNYGYLVGTEFAPGTQEELRILNGSHGIGVIHLDPENPTESQILIPSRELDVVDWDSANRIAVENDDFVDFMRLIRHFYQTGDLRADDWD